MSASAIYFLLIIGVFIPYLSIRTARVFARGTIEISRTKMWMKTIFIQFILLVVALIVARNNYIQLFTRPKIKAGELLAAMLILLVAAGTAVPRWHLASEERRRRLYKLVPQKASDLWIWLLISLVAGVCEEIIYRGITFSILYWWLGSWWLAAIISAIAFALAHWVQGWKSALTIFVLALSLQLLVWLSGTLYLAMAVHFIYDVVAGVIYWQLGKQLKSPESPGTILKSGSLEVSES